MSKKRKFNRKMQKKLALLFIGILLVLIVLNIRVSLISAKSGDKYKKQVLSQQKYDSREIPYKRGDILDRNGTVLAMSQKVYNLVIDCKTINSKDKKEVQKFLEPTVKALVDQLGIDEGELRTLLTSEETATSQYYILKKGITLEEKQAFESYTTIPKDERKNFTEEERAARDHVSGVWFEDQYIREYPGGTLASNLLGFSNANNQGTSGIERYYDSQLNGINGREYGYLNEDLELKRTTVKPENGNKIVSTIDSNIQGIVEEKIQEFNETYKNGPNQSLKGKGSSSTNVIVMNPSNGEILAMADSNNYDLNEPHDLSNYYSEAEIAQMSEEDKVEALNGIWKNYTVSNPIELGSTFKPMTVSAALESASVTEDSTYFCDGYEMIAGIRIACANTSGHGHETLGDVLKNSCNDGIMQISRAMGKDVFRKYQADFNFGRLTGIDLSGEEAGELHIDNMGPVELATDSFGQGFSATMIQEISAFSSVINGGFYYKPHVVNKILDENGNLMKNIDPILQRQVVSRETSNTVKKFLQRGVAEGTGRKAKVEGYSMGGKTGTGETLPRGNHEYVVSFIGFAPVEDPKVVVYVVVDRPNVENQADSSYAQEVAKNIFTDILPYMGIQKDEGESASNNNHEEGSEIGAENPNIPAPPKGSNQEQSDQEYQP